MEPLEAIHTDPTPQRMGYFLVPQFSMMALSSATEPLRAANRVAGKPLYSWHLISADGQPVSSSSGFAMQAEYALSPTLEFNHLFVVASIGVHEYKNAQVFDILRRYAARGLPLGGICVGSMILARAGLLDKRRCTIHWEEHRALAEEFPSLEVSQDIYCIDGDRITCSGGTAAIDMMLALVARQHGHLLAAEIAASGYRIISGGTDTHLILVDVSARGVNGAEAEAALGAAGITVNKNAIPFDPNPPMKPSGIRIGTPAMTTRGMKEVEMKQIAQWIAQALDARNDEAKLQKIRGEVLEMAERFPLYAWLRA